MHRLAAGCLVFTLTACQRERRETRPAPPSLIVYGVSGRQSELQPGGPLSQPFIPNPGAANAEAISEGKRLFGWYNCTGCHSNGGGGIGPPLIQTNWTYGNEPANLFDTIVKGRPNGMPAWGGRIPEYQVWQLVAFVRSLNQLEPASATPVRGDNLEQDPHILGPGRGMIR